MINFSIFFKKHRKNLICLFIIALFSLAPLFWFESGLMISGADLSLVNVDEVDVFQRNLFTWNERSAFGIDNSSLVAPTFTYNLYYLILHYLGFSLATSEKIFFFLLYFFVGASGYYLARTVTKKLFLINSYLASIFGSVVLMFNFVMMVFWHNLLVGLISIIGMSCLILALYIRALENREKWLKYVFLIAFSSILISFVGMNPPAVCGIILLPLILYTIYFLALNKFQWKKVIHLLKVCFSSAALCLIINLWWMLPLMNSVQNLSLQPEFLKDLEWTLERNSEYLGLASLLRLSGYWGLYTDNWFGGPTFSFAETYTQPTLYFQIIGYFCVFMAILSLFFVKKLGSRRWIFFVGWGIIALFLSQGVHWPFTKVYWWLYWNVPRFFVFRSPYYKFLPGFLISISILASVALAYLYYWLKSKKLPIFSVLLIVVSIFLILTYSYPLLTGGVIEDRHHVPESINEQQEANQWLLEQNKEGKVFILPEQSSPYIHYIWDDHEYDGFDFMNNTLHLPGGGQKGGTVYSDDYVSMLHTVTFRELDYDLSNLLGWLNAGYVVQRNDVDWQNYPKHLFMSSPDKINSVLTDNNINKEFGNKYWDVYEVDNKPVKLQIHPANNTTLIFGDIYAMADAATFQDYQNDQTIIFEKQLAEENEFLLEKIDNIIIRQKTVDHTVINDNQGWIAEEDIAFDGEMYTGLDSFPEAVISYEIEVPRAETYELYANLHYGHDKATFYYRVNEGEWQGGVQPLDDYEVEEYVYKLTKLGEINLDKGKHVIYFKNDEPKEGNGYQNFKYFLLRTKPATNENPLPEIKYDKVNPTKYNLQVRNVQGPYFLNFLESYHPQWRARIKYDTNGESKHIEHLVGNYYANSWYIDKLGDYEIVIEYWPQRLLHIGLVISGLSLLVMILYFGYYIKRSLAS